jgi:hypothetical protein
MIDAASRSDVTVDVAGAVPLLIGIAGARDDYGSDVTALVATFGDLLAELRARHTHTPLTVLCTGAPGVEAQACSAARTHGVPTITLTGDDAGERVVSACDILLLVSSGPAHAELLALAARRQLGAPPRPDRLLAPADVGPCFMLEGSSVRRSYPPRFRGDAAAETEFEATLARRDRFNADILGAGGNRTGTDVERLRARIASVTNSLQRKTAFWRHTLYALAFLAALVQIVPITDGAYIKYSAVAVAFLAYVYVRRQDYQSRYQDYRAISEGLRVQSVWSAIGLGESVDASYLPMQQTTLQWIRSVLRTIYVLLPPAAASEDAEHVRSWIVEQRRYFEKHSHLESRDGRAVAKISGVLATGSVLASLAILGLTIGHVRNLAGPYLPDLGAAASCAALSVAVARSYGRTRGYSENANRYQRMFMVFDRALDVLNAAPEDDAHTRAVARELGRVALSEHAEWLLWQRERPIALVETSAA